ncbi:hypothetical protein AZH53_04815 [Methanomicrobiaceae archaeon CYW5]|uniref:tetratricopeptide repeat protein n=1 Tax=Methanovulcanius yangii TaxID=1789227 RepID=UPI0029CA5EFC|nr:tetratricopeptide repeat protein [Methanovulcanius yangii]MBT8507738.1 hypothetical protein [Methanovulcanius yangii]
MNRINTFAGLLCIALLCTAPVVGAEPVFSAIEEYNNAVDLAVAGEYDAALVAVDATIAADPDFTLALATKSGILSAMGRYEEALAVADATVASNPDMVYGYVARAEALINLDRSEEAIAAAEDALDRDPENLEAMILLGTAYGNLGMYEEELAVSEDALALYPDDSRAQANRFYAEFMLSGETPEPTPATLSLLPAMVGFVILGLSWTRK